MTSFTQGLCYRGCIFFATAVSTIIVSSVIKQNLTENNMENLLMFNNYIFENIFFNDSIVNYSGAAEPNAQGCAFAHPIF